MHNFRIIEHVPDSYTHNSRDFQMMCNVVDYTNGSVNHYSDSMTSVLSAKHCPTSLLMLLKKKLGFLSGDYLDADALRSILQVFPVLLKNKGSIKGIQLAVLIFIKYLHIGDTYDVQIISSDGSRNSPNSYLVKIGLPVKVDDIRLLKDLLEYVIPAGMNIKFSTQESIGDKESNFVSNDTLNVLFMDESKDGELYSSNTDKTFKIPNDVQAYGDIEVLDKMDGLSYSLLNISSIELPDSSVNDVELINVEENE